MAKKRINARGKGKRGELEGRNFLRSLGFTSAIRTAQRHGKGKSDVEAVEELPNLHIEIKFWGRFSHKKLQDAFFQAANDSEGKPYCVVWRCTHDGDTRRQWRVTWLSNRRMVTTVGASNEEFKKLLLWLNNVGYK